MESLSPKAQSLAHLFTGNTAAHAQHAGMAKAAAQLKVRAASAKARVESRYFQGEFLGPVMHSTQQMHLRSHHEMHDELIDHASSHVTRTIKDHERITRRAREQFANDTYKDQMRESRNRVIDQDNEILLRGLFNVASRPSEYRDALFLERVERVTNARNLARRHAKEWAVKGINRENQEILHRLCNTGSAYDAKKWERDFRKHKKNVKMGSKVKAVKKPKKLRHRGDFNASSSKADRDAGALLPDYDHARDRACLTYTKTKAFRANKARHDRMEAKEIKRRNKKAMLQRARAAANQAYRPGTY